MTSSVFLNPPKCINSTTSAFIDTNFSNTVNFNVGGKKYQVSRSLLEMHDDTMLTRSASDQWQKEPESEIFIERDGALFRFVLKYLRDGKVFLPLTVAKNDLINELDYYGVDIFEESIVDERTQGILAVGAFNKGAIALKETLTLARKEALELKIRRCCALVASDCIEAYMSSGNFMEKSTISFQELVDSSDKYFGTVYETMDKSIDICNEYLSKVGLKISRFSKKGLRSVSSCGNQSSFDDNFSSKKVSKYEGLYSSSFERCILYEVSLELVQLIGHE
mmetsp:Transcript_27861/g.34396  ORF Transcript_27861/g.34396 Transcript_27861/m.34396 type:complete len:279 (-) Transcript_27861:200-1036(-)